MTEPTAFQLAQAASAFQAKLARLADDLDPERARHGTWSWIATLADPARRCAVARMFPRLVAPWPPLASLAGRAARLALQDRAALLRQWCLLALAGRPGVLRCCIDRDARAALQDTLGPAFEPLMLVSPRGRPVPARAAGWTPVHWACVGYTDWTALLQPQDTTLRLMAQLSLPPGLLGVSERLRDAAADLPPATALALIDELGLEWSC